MFNTTEVRLKDCTYVTASAKTPSPVKKLANVIMENGNGQHLKPSPALPSSTTNGKKTEHLRGDSTKTKHCHGNDVKKPERCHDDRSDSSTSQGEGRRISVRQTELAYRFKEIVVRKMRGYMHVSLVSHTRARNAVNPKV